jgi:hypothetical protein
MHYYKGDNARFVLRTLLVSWKPTFDCNATFFELFDDGPPGLRVLPVALEAGPAGYHEVESAANDAGLSYLYVSKFDFVLPDIVLSSTADVIHTDYDGVLMIDGLRCHDYMHRRSLFYRSLVPSESIRGAVSSILGEYFDDR